MNQKIIALITFGFFGKEFLDAISISVSNEFQCSVIIKESRIDFGDFYDSGRRQYNANKFLMAVDTMIVPDSTKVIGLCSIDLFIPIMTFIIGQAQLGGKTGIASMYRLGNEQYGLKPNDALLLERFIKEIIHEIGHTFGLIHCFVPNCVMRSGSYVDDIDQKDRQLCSNCRTKIGLE
jgi:archaemetzincin